MVAVLEKILKKKKKKKKKNDLIKKISLSRQ